MHAVITLASDQHDPAWCDQAVDALACRDAIVGDVGSTRS